jgi:hypothetical protein
MVERHVRDLEHAVLRGSYSNLGGGSHSSIPDLALGLRSSETQVPVSCRAAAPSRPAPPSEACTV